MSGLGLNQVTPCGESIQAAKSVVRVRDLRFKYHDGTEALRGVNFDLAEGETVALLGPNGSGKTTFVLHLNGLLEGEGLVEVDGMTVTKATLNEIRSKVGIVFQDSDNQLFLPTVLEDVCFGPLNRGLSPSEATQVSKQALEQVGMAGMEAKAPYHLSAGQKKRVAIAGILAMNPQVLVLDEPTTFLDPPGQAALGKLLGSLPQSKILVTHDLQFADSLATRAVFFQEGKIVGHGAVQDVATQFRWVAG